MSLKSILDIRDTSKRWYFTIIIILYSLILIDSLLNHPFAKSSLGVSYIVLWLVPTYIILMHIYLSRLLTWIIIVVTFVVIYLIKSVDSIIDAWYWSQGIKWQPIDFYKVLIFNIVLLIFGLMILILLKPKVKV